MPGKYSIHTSSPALNSRQGATTAQGQLSSPLCITGSPLWLGSINNLTDFDPVHLFWWTVFHGCLPACLFSCLPTFVQPVSVRDRVCPAPLHPPLCSKDMSHLVTMNSRILPCWLALLEELCTLVQVVCKQDRTQPYISPSGTLLFKCRGSPQ